MNEIQNSKNVVSSHIDANGNVNVGDRYSFIVFNPKDDYTKPPPLPPTELRRYTNDQIRQWEKPNCLRPTNTDDVLIELLARRKSVNLTGNSGHGKSRMLHDIRDIAEQQGITVAWGNIKGFRSNYQDFLKDLAMQLNLRPATPYTNFGEIAYDLNLQKQHFFLLMIDNLEVLNDYPNNHPNYNAKFVESLNYLKNSDNTRLLCASREWLNGVVFEGVTSILTLHQIEISPLSSHEIQAELRRELRPEHPFLAKPNEQQVLHAEVKKSPKPYTLLEQLISRMKTHYPQQKFKDVLNHCQKNGQ